MRGKQTPKEAPQESSETRRGAEASRKQTVAHLSCKVQKFPKCQFYEGVWVAKRGTLLS